jgi:hypothetical protein
MAAELVEPSPDEQIVASAQVEVAATWSVKAYSNQQKLPTTGWNGTV